MTKVEAIIRGWLKLTAAEKKEVEDGIAKYNAGTYEQRTKMVENYETKAQGGPNVSGRCSCGCSCGCSCCGK